MKITKVFPNIKNSTAHLMYTSLGFISKKKHWIFVLILAYCTADLFVLTIHSHLVPVQTQNWNHKRLSTKQNTLLTEYIPIWDFNVFHNATIPPSMSSLQKGQEINSTQPKVSNLPLTLNGTIVHQNPAYSIANVTLKNQNKSESYQIQDEIESLARITNITSDKIYLINLTNNNMEYISISHLPDVNLQFRQQSSLLRRSKESTPVKGISQKVNRSFINKHLRSLPEILQQASVVPHWEEGKMIGYRFKYIKPGSPYEELGFRVSDVIKSVEGEQIKSELQAAELFHRLKNSSKLNMILQREGREIPFSWTVDEDVAIENNSEVRFK